MVRVMHIGAVLVLTLLSSAVADAHEEHGESERRVFTKHFNGSLFAITEREDFSLELILDESEYPIGRNVVGIVIHDSNDSDVVGAVLSVVQKAAETGEIEPGPLEITDLGNGLYTVSGLDLSREDRWELAVSVTKAGLTDSANFLFPVAREDHYPKGRYSP